MIPTRHHFDMKQDQDLHARKPGFLHAHELYYDEVQTHTQHANMLSNMIDSSRVGNQWGIMATQSSQGPEVRQQNIELHQRAQF
jgi:hypothetical protein